MMSQMSTQNILQQNGQCYMACSRYDLLDNTPYCKSTGKFICEGKPCHELINTRGDVLRLRHSDLTTTQMKIIEKCAKLRFNGVPLINLTLEEFNEFVDCATITCEVLTNWSLDDLLELFYVYCVGKYNDSNNGV